MENPRYFDLLMGTVTRIANHSYYPGKEEAVEICLEDLEELSAARRITADQLATLRDVLLGDESACLVEGAIRERFRRSDAMDTRRVAVAVSGAGSHAAFSAGVLLGFLERDDRAEDLVALGGSAFGAISALLAWDGLLRGDSRLAAEQIEGFWQDYAASTTYDALLNYSAQMALHFRPLISLPGLGTLTLLFSGRDQIRRLLERRVDFAALRPMAMADEAPGLIIRSIDVEAGQFHACQGAEITAEVVLDSAGLAPSACAGDRHRIEGMLPCPPVRELSAYLPDEIWVVELRKSVREEPGRVDPLETAAQLILDQDLHFVRHLNRLVDSGALIDGNVRHVEVHRVVMDHVLDDASRFDRSPCFIRQLLSYGKERARQFLQKRSETKRDRPIHLTR